MRKFIIVLSLIIPTAQAATLQVTDGILTGAKGVIVEGRSYDVSFQDGAAKDIYFDSGLNHRGVYPYGYYLSEMALAVLALKEQVFLDTAQGDFDSRQELTRGCGLLEENNTRPCVIATPFRFLELGNEQSYFFWFSNYSTEYSFYDEAMCENETCRTFYYIPIISLDFNSTSYDDFTWATWQPSAIPEPSTLLLLLLAPLFWWCARIKTK